MKLIDQIELTKSEPVTVYNYPDNMDEIIKSMEQVLNTVNVDFVLAPQLGIYKQIAMFRTLDNQSYVVIMNPKIVDASEQTMTVKEHSIINPVLYMNVTRPEGIRCRVTFIDGSVKTLTLTSKSARLMQIAYDIFNSVDFYSRLNYINKERAKRILKQYARRK